MPVGTTSARHVGREAPGVTRPTVPGAARARGERTLQTKGFGSRVGDPAGEILEAAKQFEAELIVMGARSLGTVGRLVLGSVSTKVMHESDSDVLIVK
jgi:nucleotide-binding universal stress UspA family protein